MRRHPSHLPTILAAVAIGACGETEPDPRPAVSAARPATDAEQRALRRAEARIQRHCVAVARSLVDPGSGPTSAQQKRAFAAADRLVAIVRAAPRADLGAGQDLRLFLSDVIENLEGSNCDARMIGRLERGLATIPP